MRRFFQGLTLIIATLGTIVFAGLAAAWGNIEFLPPVSAIADATVRGFFLYNAGVLAMCAVLNARPPSDPTVPAEIRAVVVKQLIPMVLCMGAGVICAVLAWNGLFVEHTRQVLVAVTVAPWLLIGIAFMVNDEIARRRPTNASVDLGPSPAVTPEISPGFERVSGLKGLKTALGWLILGVPGLFVLGTVLAGSYLLYFALEEIVIFNRHANLIQDILEFLPVFWEEARVITLAAPVIYALMYLMFLIAHRFTVGDVSIANRDLTDAEMTYIASGVTALKTEAEVNSFQQRYVCWGAVFLFCATMLAVPALVVLVFPVSQALHNAPDSLGNNAGSGWSLIPLVFLGIAVGIKVSNALVVHSKPRALGAYLWGSFNSTHQNGRGSADVLADITKLVRLRRLETNQPFDKHEFASAYAHLYTPFLKSITPVLAVIALVLAFLDVHAFSRIYPDRVEHSAWASLRTTTRPFAEATGVRLDCGLFGSKGDEVRKLRTGYYVDWGNDYTVNLIRFGGGDGVTLNDALRIHADLVENGTPIERTSGRKPFLGPPAGYADDCEALINAKADPAEREQLIALLVAPVASAPLSNTSN